MPVPVEATAAAVPLQPVRVAVVGLGYWGRKLASRYDQLQDAVLVGICDHADGPLSRARVQLPHVPAVASLDALLALSPELVVVAVEPVAHMTVATAALRAGCGVFVEKPLAPSAAEVDALLSLGREVGRPVMGSALWSWDGPVEALSQAVAQGSLGRVLRIEGARQNLGCQKPGHDVIDDLLPHDLQILQRLTQEPPTAVQAWGSRVAEGAALDTVTVRLMWSSGVEAELRLSWVSPEKVRRITVVGTQAMAVLDPMDAAAPLRIFPVTPADAARPEPAAVRDVVVPPVHTDVEPLLAQCAETLSCMRGAAPRMPVSMHRDVAAVLEAARASAERGGVVVAV